LSVRRSRIIKRGGSSANYKKSTFYEIALKNSQTSLKSVATEARRPEERKSSSSMNALNNISSGDEDENEAKRVSKSVQDTIKEDSKESPGLESSANSKKEENRSQLSQDIIKKEQDYVSTLMQEVNDEQSHYT